MAPAATAACLPWMARRVSSSGEGGWGLWLREGAAAVWHGGRRRHGWEGKRCRQPASWWCRARSTLPSLPARPPSRLRAVAARLARILACLEAQPATTKLAPPTTDWLVALASAVQLAPLRALLQNANNRVRRCWNKGQGEPPRGHGMLVTACPTPAA